MNLFSIIEFLEEELKSTADLERRRKLDAALDQLICIEEKISELCDSFLEIGTYADVCKDKDQSETARCGAAKEIRELADANAVYEV